MLYVMLGTIGGGVRMEMVAWGWTVTGWDVVGKMTIPPPPLLEVLLVMCDCDLGAEAETELVGELGGLGPEPEGNCMPEM